MNSPHDWLTIARDEYSDDGLIRTHQGRLIRPHPDEMIEACRPDAEDARLSAAMETISNVFLCAIAAVLAVLFLSLWLTAWSETGEACPGAPDGWLGYCSALEDR